MVQRLPMILKICKKRLIMSLYKAAAQSMALSTGLWDLLGSCPIQSDVSAKDSSNNPVHDMKAFAQKEGCKQLKSNR